MHLKLKNFASIFRKNSLTIVMHKTISKNNFNFHEKRLKMFFDLFEYIRLSKKFCHVTFYA
jgi:hypothetical protein